MNDTTARNAIGDIVEAIEHFMEEADDLKHKQQLLEAIVDLFPDHTELVNDREIVFSPIAGFKWHEHLGVFNGGARSEDPTRSEPPGSGEKSS